jgi:hypothetical protein
MGMGRDSRLLENIDKTILDDLSAENRKNLWNSVAYTNLVQRPMDKEQSTTTRPNFEDIIKGWEVTLQTILILKPKFVIKWGFLGDNNLRESTINKHFNEWEYEEINGNRFLLLKHSSQFTTKIFFIQHPSSRYSWSKWKEKINLNLPELKEII